MTVKSWYEPTQDYFVVDFLDDPIFTLPLEDTDKTEAWAMFTHGVCAVTLDGGHLRFHRLGIPMSKLGEPNKINLAERLEKAARILGYMGNDSRFFDPNALTLRQCRLASEMLTTHHDGLIKSCMKSYHSAKGRE